MHGCHLRRFQSCNSGKKINKHHLKDATQISEGEH